MQTEASRQVIPPLTVGDDGMARLDPASILGPGGAVARRLPAYELRTQQLEMAQAVARAYDPFLVNTVVGFIGPEYLADGRQIIRVRLPWRDVRQRSGSRRERSGLRGLVVVLC